MTPTSSCLGKVEDDKDDDDETNTYNLTLVHQMRSHCVEFEMGFGAEG